jgi:hypothetical protein
MMNAPPVALLKCRLWRDFVMVNFIHPFLPLFSNKVEQFIRIPVDWFAKTPNNPPQPDSLLTLGRRGLREPIIPYYRQDRRAVYERRAV